MSIHFSNICDQLDAEVFSGDSLIDDDIRKEFKELLARWDREVRRFDNIKKNIYCSFLDK